MCRHSILLAVRLYLSAFKAHKNPALLTYSLPHIAAVYNSLNVSFLKQTSHLLLVSDSSAPCRMMLGTPCILSHCPLLPSTTIRAKCQADIVSSDSCSCCFLSVRRLYLWQFGKRFEKQKGPPAVPLYLPMVSLNFCLTGAILKSSYTAYTLSEPRPRSNLSSYWVGVLVSSYILSRPEGRARRQSKWMQEETLHMCMPPRLQSTDRNIRELTEPELLCHVAKTCYVLSPAFQKVQLASVATLEHLKTTREFHQQLLHKRFRQPTRGSWLPSRCKYTEVWKPLRIHSKSQFQI